MPVITRALLRKRSEHNEGIISTMQELTLHQEELENINEVLGLTCKKIKILMLQNNIISRIENLVHLKDLEYLNMALNNVKKIEGLQNCEFLNKIDLTVNFIDVDELEDSINHLVGSSNLKDLYMMGNPCQVDWPGFESFVVAKLPQLKTLDGTEINRSLQILARQKLPQLEMELRELAIKKRNELAVLAQLKAADSIKNESIIAEQKSSSSTSTERKGGEEIMTEYEEDIRDKEKMQENRERLTENTPEVRQEIYRELAQQKKEKSDRDKANGPRERDSEKEQAAAIEETRRKEEQSGESEVKQKNEAGLEFKWDEENGKNFITLEVFVPRHLDSSLIDVDVHPTYVSIIIKTKVLRLRLPVEVQSGASKCQRSKTTGSLLVIMPKIDSKGTAHSIGVGPGVNGSKNSGSGSSNLRSFETNDRIIGGPVRGKGPVKVEKRVAVVKKLSLQEQMLADAMQCRTETSDTAQSLDAVSTTSSACHSDHLLGLESVKPLLSALPPSLLTIARTSRTDPHSDSTPSFSLEGLDRPEGSSTLLSGGIEELD